MEWISVHPLLELLKDSACPCFHICTVSPFFVIDVMLYAGTPDYCRCDLVQAEAGTHRSVKWSLSSPQSRRCQWIEHRFKRHRLHLKLNSWSTKSQVHRTPCPHTHLNRLSHPSVQWHVISSPLYCCCAFILNWINYNSTWLTCPSLF